MLSVKRGSSAILCFMLSGVFLTVLGLAGCGVREDVEDVTALAGELREEFGCDKIAVELKYSDTGLDRYSKSIHITVSDCSEFAIPLDITRTQEVLEPKVKKMAARALRKFWDESRFDSVYVRAERDGVTSEHAYKFTQLLGVKFE